MYEVIITRVSERELYLRRLKKLIQKAKNVNYVNEDGNTPLHLAAHYGLDEICQMLLEKSALVNHRNNLNQTPLHMAALENRKEAVVLLLKHGGYIELLNEEAAIAFEETVAGDVKEMIIEAGRLEKDSSIELNCQDNDEEEILEREGRGCCTLM